MSKKLAVFTLCYWFLPVAAVTAGQPLPQLDKVIAADGDPDDNLGYALSVSGDTLVAGAWQDDDVAGNSGAAYVFQRAAGGNDWTQTAKLVPDNADFAGDELGRAVHIDGDRIIAGARRDDDEGNDRGAVYIFQRGAGDWPQAAKLTAGDDAGFRDFFGDAVAISGTRVVVGAPGHRHEGGPNIGAAYVFEFDSGNGVWNRVAELIPDDGEGGDLFGSAVAIAGDTVVVGASQHDHEDISDNGAAYVFHRNPATGVWSQVDKLTADDDEALDRFGFAVAILGDRALVGAPFDDGQNRDTGAAYVFQRDAGANTFSQVQKLTADDQTLGDQFGHAVALAGERALIGAIQDDDRGEEAGAAYLFGHGGNIWQQIAKLTASDGANEDEFGFAVTLSEEVAAVGAPLADNNDNDESGSVYVFGLPSDEIFADDFDS